jgi:ribonuclease BN (tRNA processing enzyme)
MKLTILGANGPFPAPNGGCSSYLVEDGDTKILLDCGSGALSRLRSLYPDALSLDAIVLSHMHADHAGEIDLFRYMLEFGQLKAPMMVFCPEPERLRYPVFDLRQTFDGMRAAVGSLTLWFTEVRHAVKTMAVRVADADGRSLFYTADTGWFDGLVEAADGSDLLLADACLRDESNAKALKNHMTAAQVQALRRQAGCKAAILTHLFPDGTPYPPLDDCRAQYAVEGAVYEI